MIRNEMEVALVSLPCASTKTNFLPLCAGCVGRRERGKGEKKKYRRIEGEGGGGGGLID